MKKTLLLLVICLISFELSKAQTAKKPFVMVHYMPWFQSLNYSGYWGWHWTMGKLNPNKIVNGKREIASHYYPVIGPYDSQDPDVLEYQVLLMKLSGIDGVLVDWYGDENFYDYALLSQSTGAIFNWIKKANLKFALVYEDQTIKNMISGGKISSSQAITYAAKAIGYANTNWFNTSTYLKIDNKPVLLVFGPQQFKTSVEWESIFAAINPKPLFFTEDNFLSPVGAGAYPWPPMSKSVNGLLSITSLNEYLAQFYTKASSWSYKIGGAFPGFNDYYQEAGVSAGYGVLDSYNGFTFSSTIDRAVLQNCDIIQIVTWNDYGEGTIVEPTLEFGNSYLEKIQDVKRTSIDKSFSFTKLDLELPQKIYKLRKSSPWGTFFSKKIDEAFSNVISNNVARANYIIDSLIVLTDVEEKSLPDKFELMQNYPNPFNPETAISYNVQAPSYVTLKVYDVLGREVATLVDEYKQPGNYNVTFNVKTPYMASLQSGIYFYQLNAVNFSDRENHVYSETKKMLLLK